MTDLWVQLLVLCKVPEMSRTTDCTCILTNAVYNRYEFIIEENLRSVSAVSIMCLFLCKCNSDEYIKKLCCVIQVSLTQLCCVNQPDIEDN